jgi:predicted MPP superfamily phosphohydrolase
LFIFTLLLTGIYYYTGRRLISPLSISPRIKRTIWIIILISPLFLPSSFILNMLDTNPAAINLTGWLGYLAMGFFTILFAFVIVRDLILLVNRIINRGKKSAGYDPQRRRFLINSVNYSLLGTSALLTGYGLYEARRNPSVDEVNIYLPNLPGEFEGMRIVQFSDLHVGPTIKRNFVQSVVDDVNRLNADIIIFTGDLVDGHVAMLRDDVAPLKELRAPEGVYFITGNHEYYSGALAWIDEVSRLGMRVLLDNHTLIQRNDTGIILAGVTDYSAKSIIPEHVSDPFKTLDNAPDFPVKILLAHQPKNIFSASDAGFDLQISGHTHGGQYLPWSYLVTLTQPYVSGLHKYKNTRIYVNRGTGYWGPPLRLGVPSEISVLTLSSRSHKQNI